MSIPEPSLPDAWVERIWLALRATYGAAFDRQWQCPAGADPADHVRGLKSHWARELGRFQLAPDAIRYALDNLPPNPPNLIEFKAACNRRPDYAPPALPAPKADLARVAELVGSINRDTVQDPKAWARALKAREEHEKKNPPDPRHKMTAYQRDAWRTALGAEA